MLDEQYCDPLVVANAPDKRAEFGDFVMVEATRRLIEQQ
jgi:hypothetical protein